VKLRLQASMAFCYAFYHCGTADEAASEFERQRDRARVLDPLATCALWYASPAATPAGDPVLCCQAMVFSKAINVGIVADVLPPLPWALASASWPVREAAADTLSAVYEEFRQRAGQAPVQSLGSWDTVWTALQAYVFLNTPPSGGSPA